MELQPSIEKTQLPYTQSLSNYDATTHCRLARSQAELANTRILAEAGARRTLGDVERDINTEEVRRQSVEL